MNQETRNAIAAIPIQIPVTLGTGHAVPVSGPSHLSLRRVGRQDHGAVNEPSRFDRCVTVIAALLACAAVAAFLSGCGVGRLPRIDENTTITRVTDFSAMVPALTFWCVIGIGASIAALIWIPIQKWIPLATLTFFVSCIVAAWTVDWLNQWMPWIIGGGMCVGLLWALPYLRNVLLAVRRSWNEPQDAPNPPIIDKILKP